MSKTGTAKLRQRRENAFREQGGLCWYCKEPMVIRVLPRGQPAPDDTCTLEHRHPRGDPARRPDTFKANVAACRRCNLEEGRKHAAALEAQRRTPGGVVGEEGNQGDVVPAAGARPEREGPKEKPPGPKLGGSVDRGVPYPIEFA